MHTQGLSEAQIGRADDWIQNVHPGQNEVQSVYRRANDRIHVGDTFSGRNVWLKRSLSTAFIAKSEIGDKGLDVADGRADRSQCIGPSDPVDRSVRLCQGGYKFGVRYDLIDGVFEA